MELTGDDIRRLRIKSGVSQAALARKMSVDRKTIQNWEKGTSQPLANQFFKLCVICNINALLLITRLSKRRSTDLPINTDGLNSEDL